MSEVLNDKTSLALMEAIEENLIELSKLYRNWPQAEVNDGVDIFWTITNVPFPLFNSILRAQLAADTIDKAIEAATTRSKLRNVPILWWTGPATQPVDLGVHLEKHNFSYKGDSPGMAVDLLNLNKNLQSVPELVVKTVDDVETLRTWSHILATGFGLPDFVDKAFLDFFSSVGLGIQLSIRHYIGWLNEEPVAVSSLFLGAGVAGIYNVATVPKARRQGIGSAMTIKPLHEAYTMGYRVGVVQSSGMGVGLYRKLGFQEYCTLSQYVWASDA